MPELHIAANATPKPQISRTDTAAAEDPGPGGADFGALLAAEVGGSHSANPSGTPPPADDDDSRSEVRAEEPAPPTLDPARNVADVVAALVGLASSGAAPGIQPTVVAQTDLPRTPGASSARHQQLAAAGLAHPEPFSAGRQPARPQERPSGLLPAPQAVDSATAPGAAMPGATSAADRAGPALPAALEHTEEMKAPAGPPSHVAPHGTLPAAKYGERLAVSLPQTVGAPGWGEALAQRIVVLAASDEQIAEIRVNPPHLGPIEVVLTLQGNEASQASVQFASPHQAVREAIEAALPRLREMMAEAGIALGNATVNAGTSDQFAGAEENRARFGQTGAQNGRAATTPGAPAATHAIRRGLVDIFA